MDKHFFQHGRDLNCHYTVDEHPIQRDFPMHAHARAELYCFLSGDARYVVEGSVYPLEPYTVMLMRTAESHHLTLLSDKPYERLAIHFAPSLFEGEPDAKLLLAPFFDRPLGARNRYVPESFASERWRTAIDSLLTLSESPFDRSAHLTRNLTVLLEELSTAFYGAAPVNEADSAESEGDISRLIIEYINSRLFEEISLSSVSEKFFLSPSQMNRIFRRATGSSVWEYILAKRLAIAREKIRAGCGAREAAQTSGFWDYSSFYRAYRARFGNTPKEDMPGRA